MVRVPLRYQIIGVLADVGAIQDLCAKLGAVIERSQHRRIGSEEDVKLAAHADGGCESPQTFDLHRLPRMVRIQNGIPQFVDHVTMLPSFSEVPRAICRMISGIWRVFPRSISGRYIRMAVIFLAMLPAFDYKGK